MTEKSNVQVVINGKVLTMSGYEDELHIQRVASHVNKVYKEMTATDAYRRLPPDIRPIFINLNLADELVKAQESIEQLEADLARRAEELSELKAELVDAKMKASNGQK